MDGPLLRISEGGSLAPSRCAIDRRRQLTRARRIGLGVAADRPECQQRQAQGFARRQGDAHVPGTRPPLGRPRVGRLNALHPTTVRKQVQFRLDRAGGWGTFGKKLEFTNACRRTTGRRSSTSWPPARRRTARTGPCSAGSAHCPRPLPVASRAARLGAPPVPLDRPAGRARGLDGLVVERQVPPHLRPADLPRTSCARLQDEPVRGPEGQVRPARLPRHLRVEAWPGLAPRELLRDAQGHWCLLLQLPRPQPARGRLRPSACYRGGLRGPGTARRTA